MFRAALIALVLTSSLVLAGPADAAEPSGTPYHCPEGGPNAMTVERVQWINIVELVYTVVGSDLVCSSVPHPCPMGARTSMKTRVSIQCGRSSDLLFFCPTASGWYRAFILGNFTADGHYVSWNEYYGIVETPSRAYAGSLAELTYLPGFTSADAEILRLYWAFFNREADLGGAKYWLATADAGANPDDIAYSFFASAEFQSRYGATTNREFIEIVYRNVLGRTYDEEGFRYWLDLLDTGRLHRGGVVRWIAAGHEFIDSHPYPNPDSRPGGILFGDPNHPCSWPE